MTKKTSRLSGFYKLSPKERLKIIKKFANLTDEEVKLLSKEGNLGLKKADKMIENVIGIKNIPLGIATNFIINGKEILVPMSIEEPSVVAAASHAAKLARKTGGFKCSHTDPVMIGQIQVVKVPDLENAKKAVLSKKEKIREIANSQHKTIVKLGGGFRDLKTRTIETELGTMLLVELYIDVRDAMGANVVNSTLEAISPLIEDLTKGKVYLRILTNLATERLVTAKVVYSKDEIGEDIIEGILYANAFANSDPYRCATHNKGIMNGIIAVGLATSQDTRAIEAGAHAYASTSGKYQSLTKWEKDKDGNLVGTIKLPMPVGTVGGATRTDPIAQICMKILGVNKATELGEIMASVGMANNFAAMRALVSEGIIKGHMELHARNIAIIAGATGKMIDEVAEKMIKEGKVKVDRAKEILEKS
jgi:hydroxymethylglutaryl-CoA reductase